jgi:3-oxoacyl-[acyl-carrier protein] reductase
MRTAFVTGASRGIGKAVALTLAEMGYRLALIATDKAKLEQVAHTLKDPLVFPLDVSHPDQVAEAVKKTYEKTSRIDLLFNGAGIVHYGTSELPQQDLQAMMQVNLMGAFHCIQQIAPYMKQQRSGYIFNVSSRAGKVGFATHGGYCASKFALIGLNEALFNELISYGVKVTALCPGWVDTDMAAKSPIVPADRIPVADIANTVRFLLSLSPQASVREILIECTKNVISALPK